MLQPPAGEVGALGACGSRTASPGVVGAVYGKRLKEACERVLCTGVGGPRGGGGGMGLQRGRWIPVHLTHRLSPRHIF